MLISKNQILQLKSHMTLESFLKMGIMIVVVFILLVSGYTLIRPISPEKYHQVSKLSLQAQYPRTQDLAKYLQTQPYISTHQYFRLMRAHAYEAVRIKEYPAMAIEDE
ncbi:hypothetical protein HX005_07355 [Acinetobacter sp. R933-2]|uniref:hypothetical protein n=1 Tax=Acinetobacter sp. R933-2 TaxID=2746728 RepID=UPI0025751E2D|nr:hypothetical protein [Acinetobacter sp. R933-2]MDM1247201.1 hypothetical protein [Acinetobacter sp. R933-2]